MDFGAVDQLKAIRNMTRRRGRMSFVEEATPAAASLLALCKACPLSAFADEAFGALVAKSFARGIGVGFEISTPVAPRNFKNSFSHCSTKLGGQDMRVALHSK